MYRDHRKGPGGPPGGATYPGGPRGLKWEGNQPLVGWCAPLGPPLRLGLETLEGGGGQREREKGWLAPQARGAPPLLGGQVPPPWPPPPWEIASPRAGAPLGAYIKEGRGEGSHTLCVGASLPLLHLVLLPQHLGEALPEFCCIHHHAVVLLDHHQPLIPPCWIKKEETSPIPYVC